MNLQHRSSYSDQDIQPVVVVSGLPRSGTSMMMQALRAGGVPVLDDGRRVADEDNPEGYLEFDAVKAMPRGDTAFLDEAAGHAVKVIHALLRHLPPNHRYKVIFMMRDLEEVLASQRVMLDRQGRSGAAMDSKRLTEVLRQQREQALAWA